MSASRFMGFDWVEATLAERCARWHELDERFGTDECSPLHHDNRCELHKVRLGGSRRTEDGKP